MILITQIISTILYLKWSGNDDNKKQQGLKDCSACATLKCLENDKSFINVNTLLKLQQERDVVK